MSTARERRIDVAGHPKELEIVPKLSELDAFKNKKPPAMKTREDAYVRFLISLSSFYFDMAFLCLY